MADQRITGQQGSVHLRFLRPAVPGGPARPRPAGRLADTRDDWMAGWARDEHPGAPAAAYPRPAAAYPRPAAAYPRPAARVVALDDLDAALPAGTARVTPAQRRRVLDERLRQVTRLQRS